MKYIKLYDNQTTALGEVISTPNVVALKNSSKVLYVPKEAGEKVTIIQNEDFISYEAVK